MERQVLIKAPVFVFNRGDLLVFDNVRFAEMYLEPVDVRNGEYIGFDQTGRRLSIETKGREVSICPTSERDIEMFSSLLRSFLTAVAPDNSSVLAMTFDELIAACKAFIIF